MNKLIIQLTAVLLCSFTAGCAMRSPATAKAAPLPATFTSPDAAHLKELRQRAELFTQAMCRSFRTGDFKYWQEALKKESTPGQILRVDKNRFLQMRNRLEKDWGKLVSCRYLGELDQSILQDFIWKCTFESTTDQGTVIRLEELFVVRCTLHNGKGTFTGFGFRFFNRPGFRNQLKKTVLSPEKAGKKQ